MNIMLIGFKSCGKSTLGKALAAHLSMDFIDTDTLMEECHEHDKHERLSFRDIYQTYGKSYFRNLEQRVIDRLGCMDNTVFAVGGGTFINHSVPSAIRKNSRLIYLDVHPDILLKRIKQGGIPAFFKSENIEEEFYRLYSERKPSYSSIADDIISINEDDIQTLIRVIVERL